MKESGWLLGVWLEHFCGQWCHFLRKGAVVKMLHSEGAGRPPLPDVQKAADFMNLQLQGRTEPGIQIWVLLASNSGEGNGTPLQYSCLENPMDRGGWQAAVHEVAKSQTHLSDFTFTFHFHALEKEMATHSSVLAWRIPGTWEPGGLPSMGAHRVGHD